jgi:hypothetical protein
MKGNRSQTPELDKLSKVKEESQLIGSFLDWLQTEGGYTICKYYEKDGGLQEAFLPARKSIEEMLAQYFKIDLRKVEWERRKLLNMIRTVQDATKENMFFKFENEGGPEE